MIKSLKQLVPSENRPLLIGIDATTIDLDLDLILGMLIAELLAELVSPIDLDRDSQAVANGRLNLEHTTQSLLGRAASHRTNRCRFSVHHLLLIAAQDIRDVMCASIHVDVAW